MPQTHVILTARVAAQLSREAPHIHIDRIARDAVHIAQHALKVRTDNQPARRVAAVARIARRYSARTVHNADPLGTALGLRFSRGRYSSAAGDVLFLV